MVPVYACMEDRSMKSFGKVTALAIGILFVLYCTAGTYGYMTFGSRVSPDIMQLYDAKDPLVLIGIIALVVKMITTYPPMIVCGRCVEHLLESNFDSTHCSLQRCPGRSLRRVHEDQCTRVHREGDHETFRDYDAVVRF